MRPTITGSLFGAAVVSSYHRAHCGCQKCVCFKSDGFEQNSAFVRRQTIRLVCAGDVGVGDRVRRAGIQGCN